MAANANFEMFLMVFLSSFVSCSVRLRLVLRHAAHITRNTTRVERLRAGEKNFFKLVSAQGTR
jgi:hypothetical protein